jgi:hypothetical protein
MIAFPILPDQIVFVLLSFEGPDRYAQAGGLGIRISQLAHALAKKGYQTHLLFVGDPVLPASEECENGKLHIYRWCQWISHYHPTGVYEGEEGKRNDYTATVPPFVIEKIARPAAEKKTIPYRFSRGMAYVRCTHTTKRPASRCRAAAARSFAVECE